MPPPGGGKADQRSLVAPPSFVVSSSPSAPRAVASQHASSSSSKPKHPSGTTARRKGNLPPVPLRSAGLAADRPAAKKPRMTSGTALHLPDLPDVKPSSAALDSPTVRAKRPLTAALSLMDTASPRSATPTAPSRPTYALNSFRPPQLPAAAAVHTPSKPQVKAGLTRTLLGGLPAVRALAGEDDGRPPPAPASGVMRAGAAGEGVKLEDALRGVSPRKPRRGGARGNLQTTAALLLASHAAGLKRFYAALRARHAALPRADVELRILAVREGREGGSPSAPPAGVRGAGLPFKKAALPVKRVPLLCAILAGPSRAGDAAEGDGAAEEEEEGGPGAKVHVLLHLDQDSTSLPPSLSRWAHPQAGQHVLGWKPWVELGSVPPEDGAEGGRLRVLGLERFVVLEP